MHHTLATTLAALLIAGTASAQSGSVTANQVSTHVGEMSVDIEVDMPSGSTGEGRPTIRFEPYQMLDEVLRGDLVFLMRHGPTDWSKRDIKNVAPTDCENQRVMTPQGLEQMQDFGFLLAANSLVPSKIVVSEWCRNQQTLERIVDGMSRWDLEVPGKVEIEVDPEVNLLLSLQGAENVSALRSRIADWDGDPEGGPLLIITHYTNIEELTQFRVFEGEMLMIDPKRDSRVLGYLRLNSAGPDVGHFPEAE